MNERIQALMEQAQELVDPYALEGEFGPKRLNAEKFAELIVRECIAQCEQVATDTDTMTKSKFVTDAGRQLHQGMWGGAKNCIGQIKEHFGVEE